MSSVITEHELNEELDLNGGLDIPTGVTILTGDLDVASGYPNGQIASNASRETTWRELHRIEGIPESISKPQGINLTGGATNALDYCNQMFGLPNLFDLEHLTNI